MIDVEIGKMANEITSYLEETEKYIETGMAGFEWNTFGGSKVRLCLYNSSRYILADQNKIKIKEE
jgi:hypothetical protein